MKQLFLSIYGVIICYSLSAQETTTYQGDTDDINNAFIIEGAYTGDIFCNTTGGIKTGWGYLGMANLRGSFDTETARWWKGGLFVIHGASTHGDTPTETYIGDLQTASNIEAGDHIYIQELWYKQSLGAVDLTFGVQDLNAEFIVSETGGLFLNSSLGIPSLMSYNLPVPIFPLTSLGVMAKCQLSEDFVWQGAIFDGNPTQWEDNAYNLEWKVNKDDGYLMITEVQATKKISDLKGVYKAGTFYHTGLTETDEETGISNTIFGYDYGFYFLGDQMIMENETTNRSLSLFGQASFCPDNINTHHYYLGGGLTYIGFLNKQGKDALGIAVAHAGFKDKIVKHETTIELSYQTPIVENLYIQPDLQYIINPAGTDEILNDALALFVRVGINF